MKVYIAHPIDYADSLSRDWLEGAQRTWERVCSHDPGTKLPREGSSVAMYYPSDAFSVMGTPNGYVNEVNQAALDAANAVIVLLPDHVRSWGVPAELERALNQGKSVALFAKAPSSGSWARHDAGMKHQESKTYPSGAVLKVWYHSEASQLEVMDEIYSWIKHRVNLAKGKVSISWTPSAPEVSRMEIRPRPSAPSKKGVWPGKPRTSSEGEEDTKEKSGEVSLRFQALGEGARLPSRGYPDDAGLDLYVSQDTVIEPGTFVDVPTQVAVQLPPKTWGFLTGRSSTLRKHGLLVNPGVIDYGYRGELYAGVWNLKNSRVRLRANMRIAQLIVLKNSTEGLVPCYVDSLDEHARGRQGFGSSGF